MGHLELGGKESPDDCEVPTFSFMNQSPKSYPKGERIWTNEDLTKKQFS
jgi:hypothetical protein